MGRESVMRSFMVVGTGAGVGKTLVTSALVQSLREAGVHSVAMKPVAHGVLDSSGVWYSDEMMRLAAVSAFGLPQRVLCAHRLTAPEGQSLQGSLPGACVTMNTIVDTFQVLATWADTVVVEDASDLSETAGRQFDSADLAMELNLPFVLVVGLRKGCVGPALAYARALTGRGLEFAGWIANHVDPAWDDSDAASRALRRSLPGAYLGSIPRLDDGNAAAAARNIHFGRLLSALTRQ